MLYCLVILVFGAFASLLYPVVKVSVSASANHPDPQLVPASTEKALHDHVHALSVVIGSRSVREPMKIMEAERYIRTFLEEQGVPYELQGYDYEGMGYHNIVVHFEGVSRKDEAVIIGAHYDTIHGTPGADDNASSVAVLLELCRHLKGCEPERNLRLIFFALEEPPVYRTPSMGSYVYALQARNRGERVVGMIGLEMVGYFNDAKGSQAFPVPGMKWFFPDRGNFIGVVGNAPSRELTRAVAESMKAGSELPVEHLVALPFIPGIGMSDHGSFWKMGFPAVMVTDTAFYRNPNYHGKTDTISTLRFDRMSQLVRAMVNVAAHLTKISK